jgi:thiamine pyrophosphokinase
MSMKYALIFANGDANDGVMVRRALAAAVDPLVIAADGGARVAQSFGLPIEVVIGDFDSLDETEVAALRGKGARIEQFPPEKDATDLELALNYAAEQDAAWIRIIGGVGDRLDQTLSNLYLLALPALAGKDVRIVAGKQEAWLLQPGEHLVRGAPGDTLSLLPAGSAVQGVRTENLFYPLRGETLLFGPARGVSNVMVTDVARIWVGDGVLLAIHTVGRA